MPTYRYRCKSCKHEFEAFQSITADPLEACPECKSPVKRLIGTGAGLIFKGSGFYITDYRSDSYSKDQKADTDTTGSGGDPGSSDGKSGGDGSDSAGSAGADSGGGTDGGGAGGGAPSTSETSDSAPSNPASNS